MAADEQHDDADQCAHRGRDYELLNCRSESFAAGVVVGGVGVHGQSRIQPAATKIAPVAASPARTPSATSVRTPTPTPITAPPITDPARRATADCRIAALT